MLASVNHDKVCNTFQSLRLAIDSLSSSRRRWTVGTVYNELSFAAFSGFFRMSPLAQAACTAAPYGAMAAADVMMPQKLQLLQLCP